MGLCMNFFGLGRKSKEERSKEKTRKNTADVLEQLKDNISILEKKLELVQNKIETEDRSAHRYAESSRMLALAALKRKKLYEQQWQTLVAQRMALEKQLLAIDDARTNTLVYTAMRQSAGVLHTYNTEVPVEKVETLVDRLQEQQENVSEIAEILSADISNVSIADVDLERELDAMATEANRPVENSRMEREQAGVDNVNAHGGQSAVGNQQLNVGQSGALENEMKSKGKYGNGTANPNSAYEEDETEKYLIREFEGRNRESMLDGRNSKSGQHEAPGARQTGKKTSAAKPDNREDTETDSEKEIEQIHAKMRL